MFGLRMGTTGLFLMVFALGLLACTLGLATPPAGENGAAKSDGGRSWHRAVFDSARRKGFPADGILLLVSVSRQCLEVVRDGQCVAAYKVSTSSRGMGSRANSNRTPRGLHRVADRIGDRAPLGQRFVGRVPTSEVVPPAQWRQEEGKDMVLTRIMRLAGLEPGVNKGKGIDSYDRFIYIHGTNQEQLLGKPASHGCIRMGNRDVKELFDRTADSETWCWISPNPT